MYRKSLITSLFIIAIVFTANIGASAQVFIARGRVEMQQADGTKVPLADANIDVFRTDIKVKGISAKTNKKGEYTIAGLTFGGVFIFAASAPGAAPDIIPDIRGSIEKSFDFVLSAGDGKRLTMDEAYALKDSGNYTASGTEKLTPAQKKAQEEQQKKIDEAKAKNAKIEDSNAVTQTANKEGDTALAAKDYDTAIAKYSQGYDAAPDFLGAAPIFLNKRAVAFKLRALAHYDNYLKTKDAAERQGAKTDLQASYDSAKASLDLVTNSPAPKEPEFANSLGKFKSDSTFGMREALRLLVEANLDTSKIEELATLYQDAITAEPLPEKKTALRIAIAKMLMKSGDFDKALAEYEKVLAENPGNVDALAGKGLILTSLAGDDKAKLQEGLNVLQNFVDLAPDTHPFKADAIVMIEGYKNDQKMVPQKTPKTTPKKKP